MSETITRSAVLRIPSGTALATQVQQIGGTFATSGLNLAGLIPTGILMPSAWTAAALTAQVSADNATWSDLFDRNGIEVTFQAAASRYIVIEPSLLTGTLLFRLRSGTSAVPVNQAADRDLTIFFRDFG